MGQGPPPRGQWAGPSGQVRAALCARPGLLLGPRQVGMPPPGCPGRWAVLGSVGRTPLRSVSPVLAALSEAWLPGGSVGIAVGRVERVPETQTCPFGFPPTRWRALPVGRLLLQYAPGPRSLAPTWAALPVLGSLLPQPHTPLLESCPVGGTDSAWAEPYLHLPPTPPGCWPGPRGARALVRALSPCC